MTHTRLAFTYGYLNDQRFGLTKKIVSQGLQKSHGTFYEPHVLSNIQPELCCTVYAASPVIWVS